MNLSSRILLGCLSASAVIFSAQTMTAAVSSSKEARVTQIIREVKLLPSEAEARAAAVNDRVAEDTSVRTGDKSRSELTFTDLTITRLGANSIFSFNKAGRSVDLGGGSILLRVPKESGGANIRAAAVSVAITGTTLILETARSGRSKLIVLEDGARLALRKYPAQMRNVQAGQMLDVPAGATTLPEPVDIDLNQVMKSHPLIAGFPPLPSQSLIAAAAERQRTKGPPEEPVYQGQPVAGPGLTGGVGLPGIRLPGLFGGSGNPKDPQRGGHRQRGKAAKSPKTQPSPSNQNSPSGR